MTLVEDFFRKSKGSSGGANRNRFDFRYEAALRALRLERYRKRNKQKILEKEKEYKDDEKTVFDRANIIREILDREFVVADLYAPSQKNQIKVGGADKESAVRAVVDIAQKLSDDGKKRLKPGTYVIRVYSPNAIDRDRPRFKLVLQAKTEQNGGSE